MRIKITYFKRQGWLAIHGQIAAFDPHLSSYSERLGHYFLANDIVDADKKKAMLLTVCDPSTYQLLKSLLQPETTNELCPASGTSQKPLQSNLVCYYATV